MRDDGVTKRRKLHETATENGTYIYQNPEEKQSLHQISYQGHGCLVGNIYMSIQIHMSIVCETQHIIRRNNSFYIFDILHMIQNPHLHVGPSHLTIKSLQTIKQAVSYTPCGRFFPDLRTLISETVYSEANLIYFWLNQFGPTACTVRRGWKWEKISHVLRI